MGNGSGTGHQSLGQRVQNQERRLKRVERELQARSCGEDDHYLRFVGRRVRILFEHGESGQALLKEVGRFTMLIETEAGEYVWNKSLIHSMTLAED